MSAKVSDKHSLKDYIAKWIWMHNSWYDQYTGLVYAGIIPQSRVGTSGEHVWIS